MTFQELEALVKSIYLLVDPGIIKVICATVISHRLPADPVWLFVVSPSSGGKTELLNALNAVEKVVPIDSLTTQTLISGQKGSIKNSLLFKYNNHIFTFKDFTTVLSMQNDARNEILSQFRKTYDGEFTKQFGNGEGRTWRGKITLISGVTTIIHVAQKMYAAMGERFVLYSMIQPPRQEVSMRALQNLAGKNMKEQRLLIRDAFAAYLNNLEVPDTMPEITEELKRDLINVADLATLARSAVERNWSSPQKEITFVHDPEMPIRFALQLCTLAASLRVMNGGAAAKLTDADKNILYKVALDSIPTHRRVCLQELARYENIQTSGLATKLGFSTGTVRMWLEELNAFKLVNRSKDKNHDVWTLSPQWRPTIERFEHIDMLQEQLTEDVANEVPAGTDLEKEAKKVFGISDEAS